MKKRFTKIDRIGIVFEGQLNYMFLDNQPLFIPHEAESFSENVQFIIDIIQLFNVKNIDYLGCNTLNFPDWKAYYDIIQTNTNAIVGASNDMTGNIQYGGDWIMESTGTDIEMIYFNSSIGYYKYLLGSSSNYFLLGVDITTFYIKTSPQSGPPIEYYIQNNRIFNDTNTLYMHGTRKPCNYFINNVDIGRFYQVDTFTKAIDLGAYNIAIANTTWGGPQSNIFNNAKWIWNVAGAITSAPGSVFIWFYYTFYSNSVKTGKINVICDNHANVYFNQSDLGIADGGWGLNSVGNEKSINIVNGLNYIRIAAYNAGTVNNPAGLLVTVRDSSGNNIANSNANWAISTSTAYKLGALTYNSM
jgi:hypothetical protein